MEESRKLPYLQAVINEGFRIKNPLTLGHFKVVPPGGDTLNGVYLPGGTAIGHNSVALSRNPKVFGADVDVFRPERFSDAPEEERIRMEKALDIMFGGGRWTCAGKSVVTMELQKTIFEVNPF
jgi:cytochrome P450